MSHLSFGVFISCVPCNVFPKLSVNYRKIKSFWLTNYSMCLFCVIQESVFLRSNDKIQVINHKLWNKCVAWFNIQGLHKNELSINTHKYIYIYIYVHMSVCVCVCVCVCVYSRTVGWGIMLKAGRTRVRFPNGIIRIFYCHNPSYFTMSVGSNHPLTEVSIRNTSWG